MICGLLLGIVCLWQDEWRVGAKVLPSKVGNKKASQKQENEERQKQYHMTR
jgi:hypothetical protein